MGRKKKNVARTKSGRPSRAKAATHDRGTERTQATQALYGQDGADAIGRAYRVGLLGDGQDAKALLDMGRKMFRAYWQAYGIGPITCTLGDKNYGATTAINHAIVKEREQWLEDNLKRIGNMGTPMRKAFDQLVIDVNPDHGPQWLDRLCWQARRDMDMSPADLSKLAMAIEALELCK